MSIKSMLVGFQAIQVENSQTEFLALVNRTKEKYLKMIKSCPHNSLQIFDGWKSIRLDNCQIFPGPTICGFENADYTGTFVTTFLRNVLVSEGHITLIVERSLTIEQRKYGESDGKTV